MPLSTTLGSGGAEAIIMESRQELAAEGRAVLIAGVDPAEAPSP